MIIRSKSLQRNIHNEGLSNQQALIFLLAAFPVALIATGLFLNVAIKQDQILGKRPLQNSSSETPKLPPKEESKTADRNHLPIPAEENIEQEVNGIVELGSSVTGAPIRLVKGSVDSSNSQFREFQYQLGTSTVQAVADCKDQSWTSYPERQVNRPKSPATERMLSLVCGNSPLVNQDTKAPAPDTLYPGMAIVFNPPSNIRKSPGGAFLCTVSDRRSIRIGQAQGDWYPTSACETHGFIHQSQVRF